MFNLSHFRAVILISDADTKRMKNTLKNVTYVCSTGCQGVGVTFKPTGNVGSSGFTVSTSNPEGPGGATGLGRVGSCIT